MPIAYRTDCDSGIPDHPQGHVDESQRSLDESAQTGLVTVRQVPCHGQIFLQYRTLRVRSGTPHSYGLQDHFVEYGDNGRIEEV